MKQLYLLACLLILSLTACSDAPSDAPASNTQNQQPVLQADGDRINTDQPTPTPTDIVLATPTPQPPPPTPTPKPSPTVTSITETPTPAVPEPTPVPTLNVEMILIPAGPFTMGTDNGDPEEGPAQVVHLPDYEIDKFEVTNDDFNLFVSLTGYITYSEGSGGQSWRRFAQGKGNHPVVKVTWEDAVAFCDWAGKRLPTEAEWEKAARGTEGQAYPWGNIFDGALANVKATGLRGTVAVGSFPGGASVYGVEDMGGNVWEWTASWFQAYPGNPINNQYFGEQFRVTRGGAWFEEPPQVTAYNRNAADPIITANDDIGFRCVRDVE